MSLVPVGFGSSGEAYTIDDSLRFRSSASAYLSRTPSSTSDRTEWTWSGWVKKSQIAASLSLFSADHAGGANAYLSMLLNDSDEFQIFEYNGSAYTLRLASNAVFRDPAAWYHLVCAVDTDQGTDTNRIKLYVNGVQLTSLRLADYPASAHTTYVNVTGNLHAVGATVGSSDGSPYRYLDGYLTEVNFIDGQALTADDFGEFDDNGTWKPIEFEGTYGTNGFYLPFRNPDGGTVSADYLTVAGGGGGRNYGGGGGGQVSSLTSQTLDLSNSYTVTVGAGGAGGTDGSNSVFAITTANSGKGTGGAGFSPGGASGSGFAGGAGANLSNPYLGGGGGGDSAVGNNRSGTTSGSGGAGTANSISGSSVYRGGGGGAGAEGSGSRGLGQHGGGNGAPPPYGTGTSGTVNTGGGGGGDQGQQAPRYSGGSGVVIISYSGAQQFSGGTITSSGGNTIHTFTSSGMLLAVFNDSSGNDNNWTGNNFNVSDSTATTYDLMKDTPSLVDADAGNFATLNPLYLGSLQTLSQGNLTSAKTTGTSISDVWGTFGITEGKWYFECYVSALAGSLYIGIGQGGGIGEPRDDLAVSPTSYSYENGGNKRYGSTSSSYGDTYTVGDVVGCAIDMDDGKIWWSKNGTWQASGDPSAGTNAAFTDLLTKGSDAFLSFSSTNGASNSNTLSWNFGQRPFAYTPPSGFLKLNTFNLPDSTIEKGSDYFNTVLYTGDGTANRNIPTGFPGGFTWIKNRNLANSHTLSDVVRGDGKTLFTNATNAEVDYGVNGIDLVADGFDVTHNASNNLFNVSGRTYAAWNWKANGAGVSNTAGTNGATIASTYSANTTSGFSISTHEAQAGTYSFYHGLGVAPSMFVFKNMDAASNWVYWQSDLEAAPTKKALYLDTTSAVGSSGSNWLQSVTSNVIELTAGQRHGTSGTYITYAFAEVSGYSAFGSYTGNGLADGTFVYTGFRPAWILIKQTNSGSFNWNLIDTSRSPYNTADDLLAPNANNAEVVSGFVDAVSNGFKCRNSSAYVNGSGSTYIYMAFAENPFKNANAR